MMESAGKTVLLCDHSKFGETSSLRIGPVSFVNTIITDKEPSRLWVEYLRDQEIELIY